MNSTCYHSRTWATCFRVPGLRVYNISRCTDKQCTSQISAMCTYVLKHLCAARHVTRLSVHCSHEGLSHKPRWHLLHIWRFVWSSNSIAPLGVSYVQEKHCCTCVTSDPTDCHRQQRVTGEVIPQNVGKHAQGLCTWGFVMVTPLGRGTLWSIFVPRGHSHWLLC